MDNEQTARPATAGPVAVQAGTVLQPSMALALNMHASPGVYALLLGSGISIASGVKTGWGVVQDLVGKVAAVRSPGDAEARAAAMADPEHWREANYGQPLGYSSLLAAVAPTPAARQALLAGYFESEDDEDDKGPTAAHRAIARLVKRGSVKGILTTNFDRLMERALQEAGISCSTGRWTSTGWSSGAGPRTGTRRWCVPSRAPVRAGTVALLRAVGATDQRRRLGEQVTQRAPHVVGALLVREQELLELTGLGQAQLGKSEQDLVLPGAAESSEREQGGQKTPARCTSTTRPKGLGPLN
ncbi:hypothetical protein AB0F42_33300 [Streptomyces buecherae]|uniref:hypothetical protein n=1 Tax=Streptomyces buecherae TaxID=2763006 RepID=UPI0033E1A7C6